MESLGFDTSPGRCQGAIPVEGAVDSWGQEEGSQGQGQVVHTWRDPQQKVFKDGRGRETEGHCLDRDRTTDREPHGRKPK